MSDQQAEDPVGPGSVLANISNALVSLHKEQFGRGPTQARSGFATEDTLVCVLEHALLPAERALTQMGEGLRVQESRVFFQNATRAKFIETAERIVGRRVVAFSSATDPDSEIVYEIFSFEPR